MEVAKEEEIEMDLGLSIGGASFRRTVKPEMDAGGDTTPAANEYGMVTVMRTSSATVLDPPAKREMQALRRQEAKRKREEKKTRALAGEQQPPAKKNGSLTQDNNVPGHFPAPATVQFFPYSNRYAYPCVVPCWADGAGAVAGGGYSNGCISEQNGKTASLNNGSPICGSSTVSEHHSAASHEGGSCDTRSHSSLLNGSIEKNNISQSEHTATSHSIESNHSLVIQPKEEPVSNEEPKEPSKPEIKSSKGSETKKAPAMPQMPYVSTTGNGPNGKTVHGFLYRYSKAEISIVCVCHGSTFSPVEFVQHAGGTDLSNPLKHIRVTPSAFG